jgi:16S rRNA (uracil1498-N3)-methyltransferase
MEVGDSSKTGYEASFGFAKTQGNWRFEHLTNGEGLLVKAEIIDDHQKRVAVKFLEKIVDFEEKQYKLHIAIAPTKSNDRTEWFVEKATEMGISEITPLICEHSERRVFKTDRIKKVAIAAMKQSLKSFLPKINDPIKFSDFIEAQHSEKEKYIAHLVDQKRNSLKENIQENSSHLILIGPEGDFSENEVKTALDKGFKPVKLGNSRLRTETAAVAAAHSIYFINE